MKGNNPKYAEKAAELGELMAKQNIRLVYGGGSVGLMGVIGSSILEHGGHAIGVAPHFLNTREVLHTNLNEMHMVDTMFERRNLMIDLSDAFIAMPGGYGTLDEIGEVLMLTILGKRKFPCGFLNVAGYYDPMIEMLDKMMNEGFLQAAYRANAIFADEPADLLALMHNFTLPQYDKFSSGDIHK